MHVATVWSPSLTIIARQTEKNTVYVKLTTSKTRNKITQCLEVPVSKKWLKSEAIIISI